MKISKVAPYGVGVGFVAGLATAGVLLIGSNHPAQPAQIVVRNDAATASATHSSSAVVAKPFAVVPRSSVVVKKPTVQGATVIDPTSTDSASVDPTGPASADPADSHVLSSISNGAGQSMPPIPSVIRASSPPPPPPPPGTEQPTPTKTS